MDLDWCLTCERAVPEGILYCSKLCRPKTPPPPRRRSPTHHSWRDIPNHYNSIIAWSANIPTYAAPQEPIVPISAFQPPALLQPPRNRVLPPALSTSTPYSQPPPPPTPIPRRHDSATSLTKIANRAGTPMSSNPATPPPVAGPSSFLPTTLANAANVPLLTNGIFRGNWAKNPNAPAAAAARPAAPPAPRARAPYAVSPVEYTYDEQTPSTSAAAARLALAKRPPPGPYDPPTPPRDSPLAERGRRPTRANP